LSKKYYKTTIFYKQEFAKSSKFIMNWAHVEPNIFDKCEKKCDSVFYDLVRYGEKICDSCFKEMK